MWNIFKNIGYLALGALITVAIEAIFRIISPNDQALLAWLTSMWGEAVTWLEALVGTQPFPYVVTALGAVPFGFYANEFARWYDNRHKRHLKAMTPDLEEAYQAARNLVQDFVGWHMAPREWDWRIKDVAKLDTVIIKLDELGFARTERHWSEYLENAQAMSFLSQTFAAILEYAKAEQIERAKVTMQQAVDHIDGIDPDKKDKLLL
ncbi:hypothetical protein [Cohaesibacter gelatinilyticus]|uniref:Uncharacterized protein n=1 Tax=Cohaesibacter gelatinilyticus TaxID=372072 RepID=A0A285NEB5_9HYPH|nr:hypothetical protein [Cohaesibacter gelatinilyticus]SNZ07243.1 hypothetical protein SAMN06265368_0760 [Cohaesibacter gelatinilyticus]